MAGLTFADLAQHYADLMPLLHHVLELPGASVSHSQTSAMDCVSCVAKAVGPETFDADADRVFKSIYALYGASRASHFLVG